MEQFSDGRDWIFNHQFGLFIHWGLYALGAWHEQEQWRRAIPATTYTQRMHTFNPTQFDPDEWLDLAQSVGMSYVCITAKHHEGFCLWDTAQTDYKITNTPFQRDVIEMLADACHRRDMPLCLYYSIVDWHHPNYPNQGRSHELDGPIAGGEPDIQGYMTFLKSQVRELCSNYGEIAGFWWDMNVMGIKDPSVNKVIRELQPGIIINDRGFDAGDFCTPERKSPVTSLAPAYARLVEHCQSIGRESWGFRADEDYFSVRYLQRNLLSALTRGGRFLLNVGPRADGTLPEQAIELLERLGVWYQNVCCALVNDTRTSDITSDVDAIITYSADKLYVIVLEELTVTRVLLQPYFAKPVRASVLNTGEELPFSCDVLPSELMQRNGTRKTRKHSDFLRVYDLPVNKLADSVMVLCLEFDNDVDQLVRKAQEES